MLKSTVIAHCLVNLRSGIDLEQGEQIVLQTFLDSYPKDDFWKWNAELSDEHAEHVIGAVGNASWIKVDLMIRDLW